MRLIFLFVVLLFGTALQASEKMTLNAANLEIVKLIQEYSKLSGQKFILSNEVSGLATFLNSEPVSMEEAFNQISSALALNGFAVSNQGDTMIVTVARSIQRDLVEVSTQRPAIKPQRMYTWIYSLKNIPASRAMELRLLTSAYGEMNVNKDTNQVIITDWVTNLNRIGDLLQEIDKPVDPKTAKLAAHTDKECKKCRLEKEKQ